MSENTTYYRIFSETGRVVAATVLDDATGDALSRESTTLNNANIGNADVAERATLILASTDTDLPKEFARVSVQPSGGGEGEDAQPAN